MRSIKILTLIITAAVLLVGGFYGFTQDKKMEGHVAKTFLPILEMAKAYSVEMAEAMPEDHYNFKPVPEVMSFAEQNVHSANTIFFFCFKLKGETPPKDAPKAEGKSKAEIIALLKKAFDMALETVKGLTDEEAAKVINLFGTVEMSKADTVMLLRDHTTHHRGQMVVYLRLNGIKPPQYR